MFTDPSFVHTYAGESNTFSEIMVNSTLSTPGQPAMATHAEGSFSKCPRYLPNRKFELAMFDFLELSRVFNLQPVVSVFVGKTLHNSKPDNSY